MQTHLYSYVSPRANVWLLVHPMTPTFCLSPTHFFTSLCTHLGLPHPLEVHLYDASVVIPVMT
jgi:hypothetical protein